VPRLSGRGSPRSGSGVVMSGSRSWQSPARFAFTAPARAATNARSASRSPLLRGVAARFCSNTLRAALTASSASVFPPERRSRRNRPNVDAFALGEPHVGQVKVGRVDRDGDAA
jgi:hypothetical protein